MRGVRDRVGDDPVGGWWAGVVVVGAGVRTSDIVFFCCRRKRGGTVESKLLQSCKLELLDPSLVFGVWLVWVA